MPAPGDVIHGKYRLVRLIGDGGMGSIYEARHEVLGSHVALKFLHPDLARRPSLLARFLQEAQLSATLQSPHIVQVSDIGQEGHLAFLVMELLRGETLQALLDRTRPLETSLAIEIAMQILNGLDVAHQGGVVHRDLKPENIYLVPAPYGTLVKILDFGIAKFRANPEVQAQRGLTRPGVVMGTPEYMAPEQAWSADTVDARADLYAVGVMLYEMLSGRRPVTGDDPREIAQRVVAGDLAPLGTLVPSLPTGLVATVHRAMGALPEQRFPSARDVQHALLPFAGTRPSTSSLSGMASWNPGTPTPGPAHAVSPTPEASRISVGPLPAHGGKPYGGDPHAPGVHGPGIGASRRPDPTTQRDPLPASLVAPPAGAYGGVPPAPAAVASLRSSPPAGPAGTTPGEPRGTSLGGSHDGGGTERADPLGYGAHPSAALGGGGTVQSPLPQMPPAGPGAYGPHPNAAYAGGPSFGQSYAPPTGPPRKRRRSLLMMGGLAALLGGAVAAAVVLALRGASPDESPPLSLDAGGPPPTTMTTPSSTASGVLPPPVPIFTGTMPTATTTGTGVKTSTTGTTTAPPRDAGVGGAPGDAGAGGHPGGFPTIPGLPPLPSGLPPMPSGLPPLPTFPPFPGFP